ncbi:MAG: hypothetical protein JW915_00190 [Chitinispirillaceae bacterium]|nr:hypothetical protein [Chitinispirillaceae bacterium]
MFQSVLIIQTASMPTIMPQHSDCWNTSIAATCPDILMGFSLARIINLTKKLNKMSIWLFAIAVNKKNMFDYMHYTM